MPRSSLSSPAETRAFLRVYTWLQLGPLIHLWDAGGYYTHIHWVEWSCHIVKIPLNWNCFSLVLSVWVHVCVQRMVRKNNNSCFAFCQTVIDGICTVVIGWELDNSFWFTQFTGSWEIQRFFWKILIIIMSCCKLHVLIRFSRLCWWVGGRQASRTVLGISPRDKVRGLLETWSNHRYKQWLFSFIAVGSKDVSSIVFLVLY